ncbi:hypothetical protein [Treponema vincentii]|uniref:hypothetical protein n=1 Tax=Treponema vincentii TaxID=69710 RepID=UPI0020A32D87|nr:hypothetical protein [Treponema vincentii]UTC47633.1 hypothetical protein E4N73_01655 [Treponema vincentii]
MRKILCILCGLVMSAALFAELGAPNSLESALTSGVFDNEFDTQFTPNADFGTYDQHFIYGGLGNPFAGKDAADKTSSRSGIQAWTKQLFDAEGPMRFGYYMPGKLPMSFFASFGAGVVDSLGNYSKLITERPKAKTETEWTDESRTQLVSVTQTGYYLKPLFEKSRFNFQYLIGVGTGLNLVTGLQFEYERGNWQTGSTPHSGGNWQWWDKAYTKVTRNNADDAALSYTENKKGLDASVAPSIIDTSSLLNNLRIAPYKAAASTGDVFTIKIPVAFSLAGLNHVAALSVKTDLENAGGAYYFKQNGEEKDYTSTITNLKNEIRGEYGIEIPAADRDSDSWSVNAGIEFDIKTKMERWNYNYTASGVNVTGKYAADQKPAFAFKFDVTGARMLKFVSPQRSIRFNIKPTLKFEVITGMAKRLIAGHDFRDEGYDTTVTASGSVNGTKVTHSRITKGERGTAIIRTEFTSTASVPMGLKILPEGWKVGFLLGATPEFWYKVTTAFDDSSKYQNPSITEQNTVNGADDGTGYTNEAKYPGNIAIGESLNTDYTWGFSERHTIGLTVPFEGGAHLDIRVNGNLLDIEGFAVQAFIPLGTGRKTAAAE